MVGNRYAREEVAPGIWQFRGAHDWDLGVNAVAVVSGTRAVVVDNLYRPADARRMFRHLEREGIEPTALVNTHWHTDHTIGNGLFGCPVWAHVTGPKLLRKYWPQWVGEPHDPRAGGLRLRVPDRLFRRSASLDLDGLRIELLHVPGHTPDSVGAFLPEPRIFIAGDTVMMLPFVRFGDSGQEIRSLERIQRLRPRTILQGHGPPCTAARLSGDIRYLRRVQEEASEAHRVGTSRESFSQLPLERFLPPARCRTTPKDYEAAHRSNLAKVWDETLAAR